MVGVGEHMSKDKPLPSGIKWGETCYRLKEGATCRNSTISSDSLLQIDYRWFDQHHLDCFRYMLIFSSSISVFLFFFFFFFEASSQSCRSLCCGYILVIMQLTSSCWCSGIYKTAHRIRLRLSIVLEKELKILGSA